MSSAMAELADIATIVKAQIGFMTDSAALADRACRRRHLAVAMPCGDDLVGRPRLGFGKTRLQDIGHGRVAGFSRHCDFSVFTRSLKSTFLTIVFASITFMLS